MAHALLERETLNREGVELIMRGEPLPAVILKTDHTTLDAASAAGGNGCVDPATVPGEIADARDDLDT
jgi:hypothetical protein